MGRVGESAVVFNLECKHDYAESQHNHCTWKMFDKSAAFPFWTLRHDTSLLWTLPLPSQHMMPNCSSVWFTPSLSYQLWTSHGASLLSHSFCLFLSSALNAMMTIVTNRTPRQKLPLAAKCQPPTHAYFFFSPVFSCFVFDKEAGQLYSACTGTLHTACHGCCPPRPLSHN